jgi:hypothetical protein
MVCVVFVGILLCSSRGGSSCIKIFIFHVLHTDDLFYPWGISSPSSKEGCCETILHFYVNWTTFEAVKSSSRKKKSTSLAYGLDY